MSFDDIPRESLPEGWEWAELQEIAHVLRGVSYKKHMAKDQYSEGYVPILRATNIQNDHLILDSELVFVPQNQVNDEQILEIGDIVVCMSSGSKALVGKAAQLTNEWYGSFGTFCGAIRFDRSLDQRYLGYFFLSEQYRAFIRDRSSGVNINNLRRGDLENVLIPLAPLNEQRRIVEAIEAQFTRLDAGIAALERLQANLKRYKASVLKAACEGELVSQDPDDEPAAELLARILEERRARWEDEQLARYVANGKKPPKVWQDRYEEPKPPDVDDLPELPEGWVWVTIDELLYEPLSNGRSVRTSDEGFPVLRLTALNNGYIDLSESKIGAWSAEEAEPFLVEQNVFYISRGSGSINLVGRGGLVKVEPIPVAYPDTLIRLRVNHDLFSINYLRIIWDSPIIRYQVERAAKTTAGIHKINQADIQGFVVPLPPFREQLKIFEEADRQTSIVDELVQVINANLKRAERLRQSILKEAFAGRLVPQDPSDEPASVLLERIWQEREDS